jgi:tripartite-type tricarboxylate transporter receptor subunit TctC
MSISLHVGRLTRAAAITLLGAALSMTAQAQNQATPAPYPNGPIKIIVPATAGGTTDIVARLVSKYLSEAWQVTVTVDNRAGAGGVVGAAALVASPPDGQTVLFVPSAFGVRSAIDTNLRYDPLQDLAGVGLVARAPSFLIVSPMLGVKSVAELVALGKSQAQGLEFGSAGVGSTAHLHGALFANLGGFNALHVPFKGTPEAVAEVMAGRLKYAFSPGPNALPLAKDGKILVLASSSAAGAKFLPGVPTIAQAGLAGYEGEDWFGALVPGKTPMAIREKLSKELARIMANPKVKETLMAIGAEPVSSTPTEFDAMLKSYIEKTRKLAGEMKITVQ